MLADDLAQQIQSEFSRDGVEVKSVGTASLTVTLPVEFGDVDQLFILANQFGAAIDFKSTPEGPQLVIYPDSSPAESTEENKTTSSTACFSFVLLWFLLFGSVIGGYEYFFRH